MGLSFRDVGTERVHSARRVGTCATTIIVAEGRVPTAGIERFGVVGAVHGVETAPVAPVQDLTITATGKRNTLAIRALGFSNNFVRWVSLALNRIDSGWVEAGSSACVLFCFKVPAAFSGADPSAGGDFENATGALEQS